MGIPRKTGDKTIYDGSNPLDTLKTRKTRSSHETILNIIIIDDGDNSKTTESVLTISPPIPLLTNPPSYEINHSVICHELTFEYACQILRTNGGKSSAIERSTNAELDVEFIPFLVNIMHLQLQNFENL
jgi:hypothetical protein